MSPDQNKKMEDYLRNKLNKEERAAFEMQLSTDDALKQEVELLSIVINGVKKSGRDQLKSRLQKIHETETSPASKTRRLWPMIAGIAASIALLMVVGIFIKNQKVSPQMAFENFYQPYSLQLASRDATDNKEYLKINELYFNKKYKAVLPLLKKALLTDSTNARLNLATGICHLELNLLETARLNFLAIVKSKDLRLTDKANWYLALSYLKEGKIPEMKSALASILKNTDADHHNEAKELLNALGFS